jgi:hypothetical protein
LREKAHALSELSFAWDSIVRKDNQKKNHLKHNSENTRLETLISGSFLYWNPARNVEQNVTSVFLMLCMPCVHDKGGSVSFLISMFSDQCIEQLQL